MRYCMFRWIIAAGLSAGGMGCILPDIHDEGSGGTAGAATTGGTGGTGGAVSVTSAGTSGDGGAGGGSTVSSGPGGMGGGGGAAATCDGSVLFALRFVNVAPADGAVDFCLGSNGNLSGPLAQLAEAPAGIAFDNFMQYDYQVDGPIDIRAVPAGGSCSGVSLGDVKDLCLTKAGAASATVYYLAGPNGAPALTVLEDEAQDPAALKLRFFNTIQGADGADFGLTQGSLLPTVVSTAVASNIPFAAVPPPGNTILNVPVNAAGYLEITSMPQNITWQGWGVALSGSSSAEAVVPFSTVTNNMGVILTIVAAGKVGDPQYPIQFIGFGAAEPGGGTVKPGQAPQADTQID
jgi:hypothetical protein